MAAELVQQGNELFVEEEYAEAVECYTAAVAQAPGSAAAYVHRAAAYLKLERPADALSDASKAVELEPSNPKALLRKGMAAFELEDFATAEAALRAGCALDPSSTMKMWLRKAEAELRASGGGPAGAAAGPSAAPPPPAATAATAADPAPRYRHQFYQSQTHVTVEVLAKKVPPESVDFDIQRDELGVVVRHTDGSGDYRLKLWLYGPVVPEESKGSVGSAKIEVRLKKADAAQWPDLERTSAAAARPVPLAANYSSTEMERPTYPTSNKAKGPTDWDKLEADLKAEEKDEKLEGDAALNKLFRDIYANASEDTRRAMNKSFVESNGTTLSTNWSEIGSKHTDGKPPDGMEVKKYEY